MSKADRTALEPAQRAVVESARKALANLAWPASWLRRVELMQRLRMVCNKYCTRCGCDKDTEKCECYEIL